MKGLKNWVIFLAGGISFVYCFTKACVRDSIRPREDSIMFENEDFKVIRMGDKQHKNIELATIVYKKKSEEAV